MWALIFTTNLITTCLSWSVREAKPTRTSIFNDMHAILDILNALMLSYITVLVLNAPSGYAKHIRGLKFSKEVLNATLEVIVQKLRDWVRIFARCAKFRKCCV